MSDAQYIDVMSIKMQALYFACYDGPIWVPGTSKAAPTVSPEGADSLPEPSDKASPEFAAWKQRNPWKYWEDIEDAPAN